MSSINQPPPNAFGPGEYIQFKMENDPKNKDNFLFSETHIKKSDDKEAQFQGKSKQFERVVKQFLADSGEIFIDQFEYMEGREFCYVRYYPDTGTIAFFDKNFTLLLGKPLMPPELMKKIYSTAEEILIGDDTQKKPALTESDIKGLEFQRERLQNSLEFLKSQPEPDDHFGTERFNRLAQMHILKEEIGRIDKVLSDNAPSSGIVIELGNVKASKNETDQKHSQSTQPKGPTPHVPPPLTTLKSLNPLPPASSTVITSPNTTNQVPPQPTAVPAQLADELPADAMVPLIPIVIVPVTDQLPPIPLEPLVPLTSSSEPLPPNAVIFTPGVANTLVPPSSSSASVITAIPPPPQPTLAASTVTPAPINDQQSSSTNVSAAPPNNAASIANTVPPPKQETVEQQTKKDDIPDWLKALKKNPSKQAHSEQSQKKDKPIEFTKADIELMKIYGLVPNPALAYVPGVIGYPSQSSAEPLDASTAATAATSKSAAASKQLTKEEQIAEEFRSKMNDTSISNDELYTYVEQNRKDINAIMSSESSNTLQSDFLKSRKVTFNEFVRAHYFAKVQAKWVENASTHKKNADGTDANETLLKELITQNLTDEDLFNLLQTDKIQVRFDGNWFEGTAAEGYTNLHKAFVKQRGQTVREFYSQRLLARFNADWNSQGIPECRDSLSKLMSSKGKKLTKDNKVNHTVTDKELYDEFVKLGIKSDDQVLRSPTITARFKERGFDNVEVFFKKFEKPAEADIKVTDASTVKPTVTAQPLEKAKSVEAATKAAAVSAEKPTVITEPLEHLVTLNSHGAFSNETFKLPPNVYVLAPDPKGFDTPYTLSSPSGTFEEMIYGSEQQPNSASQFPKPSSGGWKLYKPGEQVRNVHFSPWSGANNTEEEYRIWQQRLGKNAEPDSKAAGIVDPKNVPKFALVNARDRHNEQVKYGNVDKQKVKVFGQTNLNDVVTELSKKNKPKPGEKLKPIILVPFTCNYDPHKGSKGNASIHCHENDPKNTSDITTLFKT